MLHKHVLLLHGLCELLEAGALVVTFFFYFDVLPEPCMQSAFSKGLLVKCLNAYCKPIPQPFGRASSCGKLLGRERGASGRMGDGKATEDRDILGHSSLNAGALPPSYNLDQTSRTALMPALLLTSGKASSGMAGSRCSDNVARLSLHLSTLLFLVLLCVVPRWPRPASTLHSVAPLVHLSGSPERVTWSL